MSTHFYMVICPYCGGSCSSAEQCPRVKRIKYYPDGKIKRVRLRKQPTATAPANWITNTAPVPADTIKEVKHLRKKLHKEFERLAS